MKVYLITCEEKDRRGRKITVVSHGVDENLRNVIFPTEPLSHFSPKDDNDGNGPYVEVEDER